ncbi:hypothetical protein KC968_00865 [Candidatus Saccharibacteria bacterium]|nr:hypothetical protein [Candidatus Saccharibacteria bacterium]
MRNNTPIYREGIVKIELRDAVSGKLDFVTQAHNFSSNQTNEYGSWLQRNALKSGLSALGVSDTDYAPHSAANAIVLTNSTLAEDATNEWYMPGNTIGYGLKSTYAGTDIWRATVATLQLEANSGSVKWVFDWPSHAAVGTIGSVGWVDSVQQTLSDTSPIFRVSMTRMQDYASNGNWARFARADSALAFGSSGNTVVSVLNGIYAQTTTFNTNAQFTAIRGLAWDNTNDFLWVIGDNSSARRIAAYNSAGVLQTGPFAVTTRNYIALAYDGNDLWTITQDSGSSHTAWKINTTDGSDVSNFTFVTNPTAVVSGLAWEPTKNLLWMRYSGATGIQAWDTNGNKKSVEISTSVFTPSVANYSTNLNSGYDLDMISAHEVALPQATNYVYRCRLDGMGTRALLPSPVAKSNTQTLRLIYQINYS